MKFYKNALFFSFFLFPLILLISCTSTGPQTGSLSGTINLEGQADHSGIVIGIYEPADLDPDIVEANTNWPHIGVIINQHTEFDHRFSTLLKTGETDASGYFKITDIPTGSYNVVAIKNGFGFRYIYEISISEGNNGLSAKNKDKRSKIKSENSTDVLNLSSLVFDLNNRTSDFTLYPETIINSDITAPTTWQTDHHYIVEQDITVGDELTIEPGAVVRLNQGKEITSYGSFNAVGEYENFIWFTKNDGFSENLYSIEPDSNYFWDKVTLESYSQAQVRWCKFDWANIGLFNHINGFNISDCIFKENQCGFKVEGVDSTFCSNLLCLDIYNEEQAGIYYSQVSEGLIEKNIMNDCKNGMLIKDESDPEVENNYLENCQIGIEISYHSSPEVHNNEVCGFDYAIYIAHWSDPIIEKNNVNATVGIRMYNFGYRQSEIHYNNLNCSKYAIELRADHYTPIYYDVSAENNYYYTNSESEIETLLYDKHDGHEFIEGEIIYKPYLTTLNIYSGIF